MRRLTDLLACVFVGAVLVVGAPSPAAAEQGDDPSAKAEEGEKQKESSDQPDAFPAPGPYRLAIGVSAGRLSWDTPQGTRNAQWVYGLTGRYVFMDPLFASLAVDHSQYSPEAGELTVANNHLTSLAGIGGEWWINPIRFSAQLQGGLLLRTLHLEDRAETSYNATRVRPAWGVKAAVGTGMFGAATLNFVGGVRGYPPGRLDVHYGVRIEGIFGKYDRKE